MDGGTSLINTFLKAWVKEVSLDSPGGHRQGWVGRSHSIHSSIPIAQASGCPAL